MVLNANKNVQLMAVPCSIKLNNYTITRSDILLFIKYYLVFYEIILRNKVINNNVLVGSLTAHS